MALGSKSRQLLSCSIVLLLVALPLTWYYWTDLPLLHDTITYHGVANFLRLPPLNNTACAVTAIQQATPRAQQDAKASASTSMTAPASSLSTLLLCAPPHQSLHDGNASYYVANFTAYNFIYNFYQLRSSAIEGSNEQAFGAFTEVSLLMTFEENKPHSRPELDLTEAQLQASIMQHVITCSWTYANQLQAQSTGSLRQHDGNEWLLRCPHPPHASRFAPAELQLTFTPTEDDEVSRKLNATAFTVDLPLCNYRSRHRSATMCAPPAGAPLTATQMTQWIDYHLFLGVEYFIVYDRASYYHDAVWPYVEAGVAEWVAWPVIDATRHGLWRYRDQTHALLDCVERSRHFSDWLISIDPDEYVSLYSNTTLIAPPVVDQQSNVIVDSMWLRWLRAVDLYYYAPATSGAQRPDSYYNHFKLSSYDFFTQTHPHEPLLVDQYQVRRLVNNPTRPKSLVRPAAVRDISVHEVWLLGKGSKIVMWGNYELPTTDLWGFPQQSITRKHADDTPQHHAIRVNHYINMITNRTDALLKPGGAGLGQSYDMKHEFAEDTQMQMVSKELKKWKASSDWLALLQRPDST